MEPVVTMTVLYWQYLVMAVLSSIALTAFTVLAVGLTAISLGGRNFRRKVYNEGVEFWGEVMKVEE